MNGQHYEIFYLWLSNKFDIELIVSENKGQRETEKKKIMKSY